MQIVFVIPVYNEQDTLEALAKGITDHMGARPHRILFVDDGSTDASYETLLRLREQLSTVDLIKFHGNAGKTKALVAAFSRAEGSVIVTMDADLQDDPAEITTLLEKLEEGYDMACGWKIVRRDPWHKRLPSRVYNAVISLAFG